MVAARYVPERGDIVWIDFDPQAGHEQAGRPALVVSPAGYNARAGLALFCPVTRQIKGYPFEVRFPDGHPVAGVVLSDQVKNLDWRARKATFHDRAPEQVVDEVMDKLSVLVAPTG